MNISVFGTFCQEFTASLVNSKPYIPSLFLFTISIFPFCQSTTVAAHFLASSFFSLYFLTTFANNHNNSTLIPPLPTWTMAATIPTFKEFPHPNGLPCDDSTEAHVLRACLESMVNQKDLETPYIHPCPVSFHSIQDKVNWRTWVPLEDYSARDSFTGFTHTGHLKRNTWLAFFSTPTGSWVGKSAVEQEEIAWHCFAVAIITGLHGGKHVVVWDCDPRSIRDENHDLPLRPNQFMISHQHQFLQQLYKRCHVRSLWYNQDFSFSGQDKCLQHALHWIYWCSRFGDLKFQGPADPRLAGCEQVVKLK